MRRKLREELPLLSHLFGLKPWDVERLTFGEIDAYHRWAESYAEGLENGG